METMELHTKIMVELSVLGNKVDGINRRLDITNGRIAKGEVKAEENTLDINLIQQSLEIEGSASRASSERRKMYIDWLVKSAIGVLWIFFATLTMVVLQKSGIVNLSFVSPELYAEIEATTQ